MNLVSFYIKKIGGVGQGLLNYFFGPSVPLNQSKIKAYLNCPKKFYLDNLAKDKVKSAYLAQENPHEDDSSNLLYNISLKNALGMMFGLMRKGETLGESGLLNTFSRKYRTSARYDADMSLEEKGKEKLLNFYRWYMDTMAKTLESSRRIYAQVGSHKVRGTADLIDSVSGKVRIIFFKPTGKTMDKRLLAFYEYNILPVYLYAKDKYKNKLSEITVYFFEDGTPVTFDLNNKDDMTLLNRGFKNISRTVKYTEKSIRARDFHPEKGVLCHKCQYFYTCEAWAAVDKEVKDKLVDASRERLSYSKMSSYLNCPRAFKFSYIDKIRSKPRGFFSLGTSVHETFEEVYKYNGPKKNPSLKYVLKTFEKHWHREGFVDDAEEQSYKERGREMVIKYFKRYIDNGKYRPAYAIEEYFEIPIGKTAVMLGFIDRVDKLPDGTFQILDYKTEPTMRSQEAVDNDWQLLIYYLAGKLALGFEAKKMTLLMLQFDKEITTVPDPKRSEELFAKLTATAEDVVDKIRTAKDFEPKYNKYCRNCDFIEDCPLWELKDGKYVETHPELKTADTH